MSLGTAEKESGREIHHIPADIDWHMLDKSKFFLLGAALFSGVSTALYPAVVLKTRQQVSPTPVSCAAMSAAILRKEGLRGFYRGFGTSLAGTVPARALYMAALEVTKSRVGAAAAGLGCSDAAVAAVSSAAAGLSSAMAAQLVWTPVDVVSQRLMVHGGQKYRNGVDAFTKIACSDGLRGLYRGFGASILMYAPSNAVWWGSYSVAQRLIRPECGSTVAAQGLSAAVASGFSALITMPLDTVKTRLQVLEGEERRPLTMVQTARGLVKEGGLGACYRGLGPRWASMAMSATTMITTYEFLKRLSTKTTAESD